MINQSDVNIDIVDFDKAVLFNNVQIGSYYKKRELYSYNTIYGKYYPQVKSEQECIDAILNAFNQWINDSKLKV